MRRASRDGHATPPRLVDVSGYLDLALRQACLFYRWASSRGMAWEDLIGEAQLALVNAAARFDPERGVPFPCYAAVAIRNGLIRAVRQHHRYLSMVNADGKEIPAPEWPRPDPDARLDAQALLGHLTPYERGLLEDRFGLLDGEAWGMRRPENQRRVKGQRAHLVLQRALMKLRCRLGLLAGDSLRRCIRENSSCRLQVEECMS